MTADAVAARPGLRPAVPADREFLLHVYETTRTEEVARTGWDDATRAAFLRQQAHAQDVDYRGRPEIEFFVVTYDGTDVGRLYRADMPGELRLVDLALLPEWRNRGLGSALLVDLLAEADERRLPVTLHVEFWNPAQALYRRLGFVEVGHNEVYRLLERLPS